MSLDIQVRDFANKVNRIAHYDFDGFDNDDLLMPPPDGFFDDLVPDSQEPPQSQPLEETQPDTQQETQPDSSQPVHITSEAYLYWGRLVPCIPREANDKEQFAPEVLKFKTDQLLYKLGRDTKKCDFVLDLLRLSALHCTIWFDPQMNQAFVKDHSRNGTYVR